MDLINIKSPVDLKGLSLAELTDLTAQARQALMTKVSEHGGHVGPPMGVAEMIMALHYVFNSPVDKIVYDVSHQSYVHKMVTGRALAFLDHDHYDDVTGYTDPTESEHDFFNIGHTSTSISLASGLATARDLKGDSENIIAIIGDGSLSGGEAFEGLDYAATLDSNMIIIVNDNDQSIAENHGGLYRGLRELRESNGESSNNIFKALGLDYRFVADGNDLEILIDVFKDVKDIDHPIVLHIVTQKGKGYAIAEQNKEAFHWTMPFNLVTGKPKHVDNGPSYAGAIADYLMEQIKADPTVVTIIAGTPVGFGFVPDWRKAAGKQYIDVGIAEEHAVAMSSSIAKNGGSITQDALAELVDQSHGYPYFIQQFGRDAWDCASAGNITQDDVRVGVTLGWEELNRGFYMTRWNRATESEKHYLVAVADLMSEEEGDSVPVSEVSSRMKSITTSLSARRASLIEKGVLYSPAYGRIAFTVPGMDRFIKRSAQ